MASITPDGIIQAFLRVLGDKSFDFPLEAVEGLSALSQDLIKLQDEHFDTAVLVIREWCKQYSKVRDAILDRSREVTEVYPALLKNDELILKNRYPELTPLLKGRIDTLQQSPQQN